MNNFIQTFKSNLQDGGLESKYIIFKADGTSVDKDGMYFVLKLNSNDNAHRKASLVAARAYAQSIKKAIPALAHDLEFVCNAVELQDIKGLYER